ncbi:MAG: OmpA family protein [Rhodocyclaceae bacterium]|nr:MAG: OmpA family protein [Rhodocyclaceae bacterium]
MVVVPPLYRLLRASAIAGGALLSACAVPPASFIPSPPTASVTTLRLPEKKAEPTITPIAPPSPPVPVAPELPVVEQAAPKRDLSRNVYFPLGLSEVSIEASATIDRIADQLKGDNLLRVRLLSFTDDLGSKAYCVALAAQRASAVTAELLKRGVRIGQVRRRIIGCETQPGVRCVSEECRRSRNRVEFRFDK